MSQDFARCLSTSKPLSNSNENGENEIVHYACISEKEPLLKENSKCQVYWYRWYILFQFVFLSVMQTAVSSTWSPINLSAEKAYDLTKHDIVLLANWGSASLLVSLPLNMWVLVKYGMRPAVFSGAIFVFLGSGIRCLPLDVNKKYAIHIGQFLNGIAGCPLIGAVPYISNIWFPVKDRVLATGIMILTGNLGGIMSFLLGPYLVEPPNNITQHNMTNNTTKIRQEIETYLLIEFGIAAIVLVMMLIFFPNKPPLPPSASASTQRFDFIVGLKNLLKNRTYWMLVTIFCGVVASFYGWYLIMPVLYVKHGISQKTSGQIGAAMSGAAMLVGFIFCWFADRVKTHLSKLWVITVTLSYIFCLYVVAISLEWISVPPFTFTKGGLWTSMLCLSVFVFTAQSLGTELAADIAFPVNEGIANYVLSWLMVLVNTIYLTLLSFIKNQNIAFYMMLGMMSLAPPLLYFTIPKTNNRLELDLANSQQNR